MILPLNPALNLNLNLNLPRDFASKIKSKITIKTFALWLHSTAGGQG